MPASRILITLAAMLILLATLALEIDRQSHEHAQKNGQSARVAVVH